MLKSLRYLNALKKSNRCISNLTKKFTYNLCGNHFKLSKQYLCTQHVSNCNEKRNNLNKIDSEISQTFICFKYLRLIKNAVKESGPIIEQNRKLADLIKKAESSCLSPEFIDFAIKISCNFRARVGLLDVLFPNGGHFVIQYEDSDITTTKNHLIELCEKYNGNFIQGEAKWPLNFDQKGIISIRCKDPLVSDPFFDPHKEGVILSETGAEMFLKETTIEGFEYWKFYCDPWQLHEVKKKLNSITDEVEEAFIGYVPKKKFTLSQETRIDIYNVFLELCKVPTIDNVYNNVNIVE